MKCILITSLLFLVVSVSAKENLKVKIDSSTVEVEKVHRIEGDFKKFLVPNIVNDRTIGAPELPVKSWLFVGNPDQIEVQLDVKKTQVFAGRPFPVQEQDCRCETATTKSFQYNLIQYQKKLDTVSVSYLGSFRGVPISRVDVRLGTYQADLDEVTLITDANVQVNSTLFEMPNQDMKDYLILVPNHLEKGIVEFVEWKRSKGFNVEVEAIASPNNTTQYIQQVIKDHYTNKGTDFVILVGDENTLPMFKVKTANSSETPSDLPYFTMDGGTDYIPDMFTSRIVAGTDEQVRSQLAKSMEFESKSYQNSSGLNKTIGIASNEGKNPSDEEFIQQIDSRFQKVLGSQVLHLSQNDSQKSNPIVLNAALSEGAFWLTYLGHGSGTSWPSMNRSYNVSHVSQINNQNSVKPIVIDVACQNGRLLEGKLGSSLMRTEILSNNSAFGAAAYFGGTVNISWYPPAIMAQGIVFEHLNKKFRYLGQALLAGQLYLASQWNSQKDVIDNYKWYHLQGDPGMNIEF